MGVGAFGAEENALKNELIDVQRQAPTATGPVQPLLEKFGGPKSVGDSVLPVANEKLKIYSVSIFARQGR